MTTVMMSDPTWLPAQLSVTRTRTRSNVLVYKGMCVCLSSFLFFWFMTFMFTNIQFIVCVQPLSEYVSFSVMFVFIDSLCFRFKFLYRNKVNWKSDLIFNVFCFQTNKLNQLLNPKNNNRTFNSNSQQWFKETGECYCAVGHQGAVWARGLRLKVLELTDLVFLKIYVFSRNQWALSWDWDRKSDSMMDEHVGLNLNLWFYFKMKQKIKVVCGWWAGQTKHSEKHQRERTQTCYSC